MKRLPSLASVARPDIRYSVQAAFVGQKQKIYLIDPNSNKYVDGLLNSPAVYLTHTPPMTSVRLTRKRMGFVPQPPEEISPVQDEIKIDATLYFSYPDREVFSGYDQNTGLTVMVIQVWHDAEIAKWKKISQNVASKMAVVRRNQRLPTVAFYITSAFYPFDPNEPHQLIIKNDCEDYTNAVSKIRLINDGDYFEEEA
jgi:hypothetical protein